MSFGDTATVSESGSRAWAGKVSGFGTGLRVLGGKLEYVGPMGGVERPASTEDLGRAGGNSVARGASQEVGAPGPRGPAAHIIGVENVADHLVEPVAVGLGGRAPGQPPAGHDHQHTADVGDVGDGLQGVVHHGLLEVGEIGPGRAAEASAEPPTHQGLGLSPVPGSRPSGP